MSTSLTISLLMILLGAALVWAGWTDRSLRQILKGDSTPTPKAAG